MKPRLIGFRATLFLLNDHAFSISLYSFPTFNCCYGHPVYDTRLIVFLQETAQDQDHGCLLHDYIYNPKFYIQNIVYFILKGATSCQF